MKQPTLALLLLTSLAAASATTQSTESTDKSFRISMPPDWHQNEKLQKASPNIVLAYAQDRSRAEGIAPTFFIMAIPQEGKVDLDATAQATLEQAIKNLPQKDPLITKTHLDGEDARSTTYSLNQGDIQIQISATLAQHAGKLYTLQFFCDSRDAEAKLPQAQSLLASFKWTSPQK